MDYAANEKYFKPVNIKTPVYLIIGGILCFLLSSFLGSMFLIIGLLLVAGGGAWIFIANNKLSDQDYDKAVSSKIGADLKKRALNKLGVDEDEVKEIEPIIIDGYKFAGANRFKKGKDNLWRTNKYEVAMLFFSQNEVHCYKYSFSTTEDNVRDSTDVYFYSDIVTVSTSSEEASIPGQSEKASYEAFVLRTAGGNALEISVRDYDNVQRSVNAMRQLLRQKKSA